MFKQIKKQKEEKKAKITATKNSGEEITCGACKYVRKASDTNPIWQCPCCQSAYSKVNKKTKKYSQRELDQKHIDYLRN